MLARANSEFEASGPPQRSQQPKPFLPSSSPSAHNADIRQQLKKPHPAAVSARTMQHFSKPLDNRSSNVNPPPASRPAAGTGRGSLASLYGGSSSFKQEPAVVDLTGPDAQAKAKAAVYFSENDFSDDDDLDLDFKAPDALPDLPKATPTGPVSNENMPPPPTSTQTEKPLDWSSSPVSHFFPPRTTSVTSVSTDRTLKRESSGDKDSTELPAAKKRVLPQSFKHEEPEDDKGDYAQVAQTPSNKRKDFWNPTASAVKEQKKQFRTQRQQEQPTPNTGMSMGEIQEVTTSHAKGNVAISLSEEQRHVLDLVVNKSQSVFFTGAAGTGKSVLMRAIISDLKKKYAKDPERVAVTASTGLAACNIGGITLHSFSGIGLGKEDAPTLIKKIRRNPKAKNRWLKTKCLVIDEVSMVDGELFDKLSQIGRTIRNNGRPWGGIQLVITGDFFQLPPVPDHGAKRETKFAFDAATWTTSIDHTIGLTQVFRQRDPQFANMLNEMRLGRISEDTVRAFKALARPLNFNDGLGTAELFSTRNEVEGSNERRLRELPGTVRRYDALDTGKEEVRDKLLMNMMAPKSIDLKLNAQVMLIKNLDESLVNGSLGKVIGFSDEKTFDMTSVDDYDDDDPMAKARRKLLKSFSRDAETSSSGVKFPVVQFMATDGTSRVILCQPEEWKVELPNGEVQAKRTQLPLILAWALSIHKAQGQTLERVKVNLGRVFEKGQAYVALSRATTQDGLQVLGFEKSKVMAHPRVITFYNQLYSAEDAIGRKPQSITDFVANRIGTAPSKKPAREVVNLDDEEEAMASYGH
ncbi:DNA repair and recombination pif1 mitochondrial [Fusarium albosuccineum]|uniref:ATP-dependent DNA helicase PIF1 n=1 Tax=Fusarium albosuccineum TaxID=1237068 RepID=A0A8H4L6X0_9HYPO|nr:DNA repair and recombination pif1 mitochondrial [Fusarium albosuccineum]